ncbi:HTTM domain-containing protein [Roseiconus lacunae]|uniref:HTTM domain-containing protein n=1 Tax=Roseiconus lacunae TaxID=2605694 RepID=A0ABT7PS92_9BACT|nr:HTTM domain-containing protein [Roseiconus lacunae]MDM4018976.1 HTTM domain-containing protein [Roseiconus lacunae]
MSTRETVESQSGHGSYRESLAKGWEVWERFWFTPRPPHLLCAMRIAAGAMLFYCHLVLAGSLLEFLGPEAWINNEMARQLHDGAFGTHDWARSYLWHLESPTVLAVHHGFTMLVMAAMTLGLATRVVVPLALFLQLMYLHRLTGALFGLDQIVTYVTLYLAVAPCGARYSIDSIVRKRFAGRFDASPRLRWWVPDATPSVAANISTRLLQLHLCVIYLFGGMSKARGETWWNGLAVWYAVSNYEYQSINMTWLSRYPAVISALSNITMFWEVFYCALVWPKITRPFVILIAFMVHGGIALFLGMMTFGSMMIVANCIFLPPTWFLTRDELLDIEDVDDEFEVDDQLADDEALVASESELDRQLRDPGLSADERSRLRKKKEKIREAAERINRRYKALKKREAKYEARVKKLRQREAKIKDLVEKRRAKKRDAPDSDDSDRPA